jgi:predicted RNase H-like nuclease (RuvC/YqgF family)
MSDTPRNSGSQYADAMNERDQIERELKEWQTGRLIHRHNKAEITRLERELNEAKALIERLRRDLLDPPADVQELVIEKLNLVAAESVEQWRKCADELAEKLREATNATCLCPCAICAGYKEALAAYEKLKGSQ